ncbi:excalibur calcium-binding domain-containing protein [Amphritea sp.]|uniref:excalibur calcium-binding domain-containing protein n=1 Tax=Amphritea sp. TaxID=1872502 RepID=UPI003A8CE5D2
MTELGFYLGLLIAIIGSIGLIIAAFRTSILWGLAVLFLWPFSIFYLFFHWQEAKGAFKLQLFGFLILIVCAFISERDASSSVNVVHLGGHSAKPTHGTAAASNITHRFRCDGRQYCSQMHSKAEAVFFINNCPNTKMDGDHDGRPCENDSRF